MEAPKLVAYAVNLEDCVQEALEHFHPPLDYDSAEDSDDSDDEEDMGDEGKRGGPQNDLDGGKRDASSGESKKETQSAEKSENKDKDKEKEKEKDKETSEGVGPVLSKKCTGVSSLSRCCCLFSPDFFAATLSWRACKNRMIQFP
jgi:hypothetical protein